MHPKPTYEELEQRIKKLERAEYQHMKAEEASENRESTLSQIVYGMAIPTFVIDRKHIVTHWNRACEKLLNISAINMIGTRETWKAFYPEKRPVLADLIVDGAMESTVARHYIGKYSKSELVDGGYEAQVFFPKLGKDGKWLFFTATPLRDASGVVIGAIETFQDITERKRAEDALSDQLKFLQTLIDCVPVPVYYKDRSSRYIGCNKAFEVFVGISQREIVGKTFCDIGPQEPAEIYQEKDHALFENPGKQTYELKIAGKNGEEKNVVFYKATFTDDKGEVQGIIGAILDITELRKAEEQKSQLEQQLRQTQKMEAIGTLAGGIAHDFNNILAAIFGFSELAMSRVEPGSMLENSLQEVLVAAERARDLVHQILTFSRQTDHETKPVQVKLIVIEALRLLRASLPTTIDIRQNVKSDALVMSDPTQIHQALMNLCTNAGHAMQGKGGVLEVALENVNLDTEFAAMHPELRSGPYVQLTVRDTGQGMSPEVMERIFNPFFTTKGKGEGTGMGLSVVHGVVKSCGGAIDVSSELGMGSSFKLYFPAIEKRSEHETIIEKSLPKGTERILFIDDEQPLVDLGKQLIESLGYKVTTRISSVGAFELFKSQPEIFDLVITDMTMPSMTGDELARNLMAVRPDIPVIICTGFSSMITEDKAKNMGIQGLILKPILKKDLAETIRRVLEKK